MNMELICPSCEARYQVPETSIGEKGRQVSCMNCGHSWHAFPPLILGSTAAPSAAASPGIDWQSPPRPGRPSSYFTEPETPPPAAPRAPEPPRQMDASRSEQLAEIREMLAEVQSEERAAAALVPDEDDFGTDDDYRTRVTPPPRPEQRAPRPGVAQPYAQPETPVVVPEPVPTPEMAPQRQPEALTDTGDDDGDTDPLRRRMAMHDRQTDKKRPDVDRLRKRHDRRARRGQRARETGSGAFFSGFLLVVIIAAVMTALYILQPQIVDRMPSTEPMLAEYVETIDGVRVHVTNGYEAARDWVVALFQENA